MANKRRRTKKPDDTKFTMRLKPATRAALAELAKADGRPLANYARRVLEAHIEAQKPSAVSLAAVPAAAA